MLIILVLVGWTLLSIPAALVVARLMSRGLDGVVDGPGRTSRARQRARVPFGYRLRQLR